MEGMPLDTWEEYIERGRFYGLDSDENMGMYFEKKDLKTLIK